MDYLIVENRQTVHLGPMNWRQRRFQEEINDLEIEYTVPVSEQGYIKVNDSLEIFPVSLEVPAADPLFECFAGPFWTYGDDIAIGKYEVESLNIATIKANIKSVVASKRYEKEVAGTTIALQSNVVSLDTTRENRNGFAQIHSQMQDDSVIDWKFSSCWLTLTKEEVKTIVNTINSYVQEQFTWEKTVVDTVDQASTVDELKQIYSELAQNNTEQVV